MSMPIYLKAGSSESLNRRYMSSNSPVGTLEVSNNKGTNLSSLKLSFKPEDVTPPNLITEEIDEILKGFRDRDGNDAVLPYLLNDDSLASRREWGWKIYKIDSLKLADLLKQLSPKEFIELTEDPLFDQFIKDAEKFGLIPEWLTEQDPEALRNNLILALRAASKGEIPHTIKELQAIYCSNKLPDNKPKSISERPPPQPQPPSLSTYQSGRSKNTLPPTSPDHRLVSATKKPHEYERYLIVQKDDSCVTNPEKKSNNTKDCKQENFYFTSQKEQDLRMKLTTLPSEYAARFTPPLIDCALGLNPQMSLLSLEIAIAEFKYHNSA